METSASFEARSAPWPYPANEPPTTHRNTTRTTSEPELPARAGRSTEATYWLAVRCPVYRGR